MIKLKHLSQEEAGTILKSGIWKNWTEREVVQVQLFQPWTCVPVAVFLNALEVVLDRHVDIEELKDPQRLRGEFIRLRDKSRKRGGIKMRKGTKVLLNIPAMGQHYGYYVGDTSYGELLFGFKDEVGWDTKNSLFKDHVGKRIKNYSEKTVKRYKLKTFWLVMPNEALRNKKKNDENKG